MSRVKVSRRLVRRRTVLKAAGAAGIAALAAPFVSVRRAHAATPIKIGMSVSSTGRFALASQSGERGIEIWLDQVKSEGGITLNGQKHPVELIKLDDRSDKTMVARVYDTLIKERGAELCFAPFGSTLTAVAAATAQRDKRFLVDWSGSADSIFEQGNPYLVSATQIAASLFSKPSIDEAIRLGVKKMAVIYLDEPFPAGFAEGAHAFMKGHIDVPMFEKYQGGTKDFTLLIEKAKATGADGFYVSDYEDNQMAIAKQMHQVNVSFPFTFMFYASQPQFLAIGPDAEYLFAESIYEKTLVFKVTAGYDRAQFAKAYDRLFPKAQYPADFQTALAYSAGVITQKYIETANSLDPAKLKQAALALNGKIVVLTGEYEIDPNGKQVGMQWAITQNLKSGPQVVYPAKVESAKAVFPIPDWSHR